MGTVGQIISKHENQILSLWTRAALRRNSARGLNGAELTSIIPSYLSSLGRSALTEPAKLSRSQREMIERHLSNRLREGFDQNEITTELASLGRCILQFIDGAAASERPSVPDVARLFAELYLTSQTASMIYREQLLEDEQTTKRYQRLLQQLVGENTHALPLGKRLPEVLSVVVEAMAAQSAALLVYDASSNRLVMSASVGEGHELLTEHVRALEVPATHLAATELEVPGALQANGVSSLLGMSLSAHHTVRGMLYVGIREPRVFTATDARRLESLSAALAVHLDNAQLRTGLQAKVDELATEIERSERFVAVLMHDLLGPLGAARHNAQRLADSSGGEEAREFATRVVGNLEHLHRMVNDLVDAHRVRAGEGIPLRLRECDLATVAQEVAGELRALHGDRFVVRGDKRVRGLWSPEQLYRALWNLCTNAVEYGAPETPITITVTSTPAGAALTVHNLGSAIPPEEQARLFRPFSRHSSKTGAPRGGPGLGLTLVCGCAEAHGGSVTVESAPGAGTTFTLLLPLDSRAYAEG